MLKIATNLVYQQQQTLHKPKYNNKPCMLKIAIDTTAKI